MAFSSSSSFSSSFMAPLAVLQSFHEMDRRVFERLLNLGKDPYAGKKIIAFWLWMESICHSQILIIIHAYPNDYLQAVAREAEAALACVENSTAKPPLGNGLRITSVLSNQPVELRFFDIHREPARRGIGQFLNGVCSVVFEDIIQKRARGPNAGEVERPVGVAVQGRPFGEGSSSGESSSGGTRPPPLPNPLLSLLSQSIDEWPVWPQRGPWAPMEFELLNEESRRALFVDAATDHDQEKKKAAAQKKKSKSTRNGRK